MREDFGFTFIEILVVIAILLIIFSITIVSFRSFQQEQALSSSTEEIINILRLAQSKTLASEGASGQGSKYGVYFDDNTDPDQYTLFKGADYASRDINSDEIHQISRLVEIYEINLGGGQEVVFNRLSGETANFGKVSLGLKSDNSKTKTVGIKSSGKITLGEETFLPDDSGRKKDSRHVHFDYSRMIDTTNESLTLTFPSVTAPPIPIASNMVAGQIYWEGEINVNGQNQKIKIHTHHLNNPDTLFSIHRDMRFDNEALTISISGDPGKLIEYSAEGLTTTKTSVFASDPQWQ